MSIGRKDCVEMVDPIFDRITASEVPESLQALVLAIWVKQNPGSQGTMLSPIGCELMRKRRTVNGNATGIFIQRPYQYIISVIDPKRNLSISHV
nr:hypothetical protein CFP56_11851 [Quercus suber]